MSHKKDGILEGPNHSQNGIEVRDEDGNVTIVEGGERLFSVEDTAEMEKLSDMITHGEFDTDSRQMAQELGFKVSEMIKRQDHREENPVSDDVFLAEGGDEPDNVVDEYLE